MLERGVWERNGGSAPARAALNEEWFQASLENAVRLDKLDIAEWMLGLGARQWGTTPIFFAQSRAAVELLVRAGASLEVRDRRERDLCRLARRDGALEAHPSARV